MAYLCILPQYVPKNLTHVLINNSSAVVENKDPISVAAVLNDPSSDNPSARVVAEPNDHSTDDQNDVPMTQDSSTSSWYITF